jgi:hypothetical protein
MSVVFVVMDNRLLPRRDDWISALEHVRRETQPQDRSHLAQAHPGDQLLECLGRLGVAEPAQDAEIVVDREDLLGLGAEPPARARTGAGSSGSLLLMFTERWHTARTPGRSPKGGRLSH